MDWTFATLDAEYERRQVAINQRTYVTIDPERLIETMEADGAAKEAAHAETTRWYRSERARLTGISWEQEQAEYDAALHSSRYAEED